MNLSKISMIFIEKPTKNGERRNVWQNPSFLPMFYQCFTKIRNRFYNSLYYNDIR